MFELILSLALVQSATAGIYRLNASEYARMPPVFDMDPYEECLQDPDALYCLAEAALVSDEPSALLDMIRDYSAHTTTHFNHSHLYYGRCVKQTCQKFYQEKGQDLKWTLEACLNESLNHKYKLKVTLLDNYYCTVPNEHIDIDTLDVSVGIVCVCIVIANLIGSFCDIFYAKECNTFLRYIRCFSLIRNWKRLMLPGHERDDPRLQRLKCLHGVRVITEVLVIAGHSCLCIFALTENTDFAENLYVTKALDYIFCGTVIMQIFFVISAFLLFYNWLIYSESAKTEWKMLPKQLFLRWIRLVPPLVLMLGLTTTWIRRMTSGPMWKKIIGDEAEHCRRNWWQNLLKINNYFDDTKCMPHTWFLAADTQLFAVALVIFMLCRNPRTRRTVLLLLFVISLLIPAAHTYYQDLDGILITSPSTMLNLFLGNPTFNHVYKRGHTNLCGYVIGITLAYVVYHVQKTGEDLQKYQKYRFIFPLLFPLGFLCWYAGTIYLAEAPRPPVYVNVLYAALLKPIYGLIVSLGIFGCIFKLEDTYRSILEWDLWTPLSRVSYCAYLIHLAIVKYYYVSQTSLQTVTYFSVVVVFLKILVLSYSTAVFLWLLVEAPFCNLKDVSFQTKKILLEGKHSVETNGKVHMDGKAK